MNLHLRADVSPITVARVTLTPSVSSAENPRCVRVMHPQDIECVAQRFALAVGGVEVPTQDTLLRLGPNSIVHALTANIAPRSRPVSIVRIPSVGPRLVDGMKSEIDAGVVSLTRDAACEHIVKIEIHGQDGLTYEIPLGQHSRMIEEGPLYTESYSYHRLGRAGAAHVWISAFARSQAFDVDILWHNGDMETGGSPFYFDSVEVEMPTGVDWIWKLGEFEWGESGGVMVPGAVRIMRATCVLGDPGGGYSCLASSSGWANGGFGPLGAPLPARGNGDGTREELLRVARRRLDAYDNFLPTVEAAPEKIIPDWLCAGIRHGGQADPADQQEFRGAGLACYPEPMLLRDLQIEQFRYACRNSIARFDLNGNAVSGELPEGSGSIGSCAYEADLMEWQPVDDDHAWRAVKASVGLFWAAGDSLSTVVCDMQRARMRRAGAQLGDRGKHYLRLLDEVVAGSRSRTWRACDLHTASEILHERLGQARYAKLDELESYRSDPCYDFENRAPFIALAQAYAGELRP